MVGLQISTIEGYDTPRDMDIAGDAGYQAVVHRQFYSETVMEIGALCSQYKNSVNSYHLITTIGDLIEIVVNDRIVKIIIANGRPEIFKYQRSKFALIEIVVVECFVRVVWMS